MAKNKSFSFFFFGMMIFVSLVFFQNCSEEVYSHPSSGSSVPFGDGVSTLVNAGPLTQDQIDKILVDCDEEAVSEVNHTDRGCVQFIFGEPDEDVSGTVVDVPEFSIQDAIDLGKKMFANVEVGPELVVVVYGDAQTLSIDMEDANFNLYINVRGNLTVGKSTTQKMAARTYFYKGEALP